MADRISQSGLKLAAKTSVVSLMTLLSRILGLVRDIVFARFFGTGLVMDAFLVAQRIPNMLRRFSAEGAFSAGFVPVMAQYRERHSHDEARDYIDAMAGTFAVVLFIVTAIGVVAAPLLVLVVAPGFISGGGDFDLAASMLRFTFPYLFFVSLTSFAGGVLNTWGRFAVPAFTPVLLNVVLIVAAVWVSPQLQQPVMALAYGILVAGLVQLCFQLPFLAQIGVLPRPRWAPANAGVRRAFRLMLPTIFGSSVAQINVLLSGIIASLLPIGSISYLHYSDRLMEFPLGLFGIALATVTLPYLSRLWAAEQRDAFASTLDWSMRVALLIVVPAAIGLAELAAPLVATLFLGGEFDARSVQMTSMALRAYAAGLVGFSFVKILAPAFFAREDTRTPVRVAIVALAVNLVLGAAAAWLMTQRGVDGPHVALAAATSVAALLNASLLFFKLRASGVLSPAPGWLSFVLRLAVANLVLWAALVLLRQSPDWWLQAAMFDRIGWLSLTVAAGMVAYFAALLALGIRPAQLRLRSG